MKRFAARHIAWTLVATAGIAAAGCKGKAAAKEGGAAEAEAASAVVAVPLTTITVAATPVRLMITGTIEADESSDVASDVAGKVIAVLVDDGVRVKKGEPLLRIDTRTAALSSREVKANVEGARIQQKLADEECARAAALLAKGAITQSEFDRAQASCTAAASQVAAIVARQAMVGKQMSDGVVRAPFDGVVTGNQVAVGEWVAPGVRLMTVVDDAPLLVALSVPESDVPKIALGQTATVKTVAFTSAPVTAKVTKVGTEIGRMTRALRVEATLAPDSALRPGMFVQAELEVGQAPLPVAPATAVVKRGQTWRAFAAVNGHLEERVVQLGASPGPGLVSIAKGVAAGDKLATTITDQVVDGTRLQ